jgi:hypothetical protein
MPWLLGGRAVVRCRNTLLRENEAVWSVFVAIEICEQLLLLGFNSRSPEYLPDAQIPKLRELQLRTAYLCCKYQKME